MLRTLARVLPVGSTSPPVVPRRLLNSNSLITFFFRLWAAKKNKNINKNYGILGGTQQTGLLPTWRVFFFFFSVQLQMTLFHCSLPAIAIKTVYSNWFLGAHNDKIQRLPILIVLHADLQAVTERDNMMRPYVLLSLSSFQRNQP